MAISNLGATIDPTAPPDREALICLSGANVVRFTYGEIRNRIARIAARIADRTEPGARVGLMAGNSADHFLAFMAVMHAGRVACPINWKLPAPTIAHIAADSEIALLVADGAQAAKAWPGAPIADLEQLCQVGPDDRMPEVAHHEAEALACIMYTSGSTGLPKGVPLTHRGYLWGIEQCLAFELAIRRARTLVAAPLYHMNAQCTLLLALRFGGMAVILPRFEVDSFLAAIDTHRITEITGVPTMMAMLLNRLDEGLPADLSSIDTISLGSAPLSDRLVARIQRRFPTARIDNGYGTTETGFIAFGAHPDPAIARPVVSLGYPHPAVSVRLVGPEAPERGELEIRTGMMASGYLNRSEASAERFVDGWYRTGDRMRRDAQGFHYFEDRTDDMFVCGGVNLYPAEVEALLEAHPDVAQAAVVGVPHDVKGAVPVAFVVARSGTSPTADSLKQHALANGPAYAHPRAIHFLDTIPLAGTAKIDRAALAALARGLPTEP